MTNQERVFLSDLKALCKKHNVVFTTTQKLSDTRRFGFKTDIGYVMGYHGERNEISLDACEVFDALRRMYPV